MRSAAARGQPEERSPRDYGEIAERFEEDVLEGRFPAARIFKAAIERQRRMLANPPDGYEFVAEKGERMCRRAERLPFHKGPRRGEPFELQPWQVWIFRTLFGWIDPTTGWRMFREASIWVPKGNGKTPLAALIALCVLLGATEGDEVYSAASTREQARLVFEAASSMLKIEADDAARVGRRSVKDHFGLVVEEHKIRGAYDNRVYRPVSAEAGSIEGIRPSVTVLDEVHVQANRKLYDNLSSAANKVENSLLVGISTAGFDMSPQAIGWQLYQRARAVLEGKAEEPTLFAIIIEAERGMDPLDFKTWEMANPNLGVSVSEAGLKKALRTLRDSPSERPSLEVKHLGWWQQTANAFLDIARWNTLAEPGLSILTLDPAEWTVVVGVDLARTRDLTAAPIVAFRPRGDGKNDYRICTRWTYLPEKSVTVGLIPELRTWEKAGWIEFVEGETMTFRPVVERICGLTQRFMTVIACVDDWMAGEVENDLAAGGVAVVSVRQGAKTQSEPMKELESAILDGRLRHDGSPVATMCMGNLLARTDRNGNIAPDRENEFKKIDVAVGIINALVVARSGAEDQVVVGDILL